MAALLDIPIRRNEDWCRTFSLSDGNGDPIDITGWTLEMNVRSRANNSALIASANVEITDINEFTVVLRGAEGSPLSAYGSPLHTENLPYDLRVTDEAGTKLVLVAGRVVLSRGVTHD